MSTLGLELDRLELRVRELERKEAERQNRELQAVLVRKQADSFLAAVKGSSAYVMEADKGEEK